MTCMYIKVYKALISITFLLFYMCCYFFFHFPDIYTPLPHSFLTLLCSHSCSRQLISIDKNPLHSRFWLDSNNRKDKQEIRRQDRDIKVHSHYLLPNPLSCGFDSSYLFRQQLLSGSRSSDLSSGNTVEPAPEHSHRWPTFSESHSR